MIIGLSLTHYIGLSTHLESSSMKSSLMELSLMTLSNLLYRIQFFVLDKTNMDVSDLYNTQSTDSNDNSLIDPKRGALLLVMTVEISEDTYG